MQIPAPDGFYWMVVDGVIAAHPAEPDYSAQKNALLASLAEKVSTRQDAEIEAVLHPLRVSLPVADGRWYALDGSSLQLLPQNTWE